MKTYKVIFNDGQYVVIGAEFVLCDPAHDIVVFTTAGAVVAAFPKAQIRGFICSTAEK